jgi:PPOX class probable F420-dependent enzyme
MPGYGLLGPGEGSGLRPFSWAEERLLRSHSYWVGTTRPDGRPHVMPVWGVWLDGRVYFSTGRQSVKARNLAAAGWVVVTNDDPDEAVVVEGSAALLDRSDGAFARFNDAYIAKYDTDVAAMGEPVYVVTPAKVIGIDEGDFVGGATRWTFDGS